MKKAFLLICMAAGLMSCAKEVLNPQEENTPKDGVPMTFNVTVLETKAVKENWANEDKIYVFFNGLETKYLVLEYNGSSWTNTSGGGTLLSTDFSGLGTKKLTAVHFPVAVDVAYADSKFSFTSGGKPVYNYYLFETGKDYTVDGTTVTVTLSMGKPSGMVQFHIADIEASVSDYTFGCSLIHPVACTNVGTDGTISESVLQAGARLSGVADADGGIFAGRLTNPGAAANYKFTLASDDNIYTLTRTDKALTAGKMYNFPALSVTGGSNWAVTEVSDLYVDLGLSVKWVKYNVGASSETGYGDYLEWAELNPRTPDNSYNYFSTYLYGDGTDTPSSFSKYTGSDFTVLQLEDDATYSNLGGDFRTPTDAEWTELRLTCNWEWQTDYNGSGVNGFLVTGTKEGYTDKSIFLPAGGWKNRSGLNSDNASLSYWSSSLVSGNNSKAWGVTYHNSSLYHDDIVRNVGRTVRPVIGAPVLSGAYEATSADIASVVASFNASEEVNPVLYLTENTSADITITRADGVIDFGGYTVSGNMFLQNDVAGKTVTLRNGTLNAPLDGNADWYDFYAGTVVLENMTITGTIFTDGHAFDIISGNYNSSIQNYTTAGKPGTVVIRGGYFSGNYDTCGDHGFRNDPSCVKGTYTLYGGKFAYSPTNSNQSCTAGYSVKSNPDGDAATYPYIVSAD